MGQKIWLKYWSTPSTAFINVNYALSGKPVSAAVDWGLVQLRSRQEITVERELKLLKKD
jgi:hypothetical protein